MCACVCAHIFQQASYSLHRCECHSIKHANYHSTCRWFSDVRFAYWIESRWPVRACGRVSHHDPGFVPGEMADPGGAHLLQAGHGVGAQEHDRVGLEGHGGAENQWELPAPKDITMRITRRQTDRRPTHHRSRNEDVARHEGVEARRQVPVFGGLVREELPGEHHVAAEGVQRHHVHASVAGVVSIEHPDLFVHL